MKCWSVTSLFQSLLVLNSLQHFMSKRRNTNNGHLEDGPIFTRALKNSREKSVNLQSTYANTYNPFTKVLISLIKTLQSESNQVCQLIIYYNNGGVSTDQLMKFKKTVGMPATFIDIEKQRFPLLTLSKIKKKSSLIEILEQREDPDQCRYLIAWSTLRFQRGLLLLARAKPTILKTHDIVIFPTYDKRMNRFLPQFKRRIVVRRVETDGKYLSRGRRALEDVRFVIEKSCEWCKIFSMVKIGDYKYPDFWINNTKSSAVMNLYGTDLLVTYTNSVPNVFPIQRSSGIDMEGLEIRMLDYAAKYLNFTYKLYQPKDGEWGRKINGSWTGKVGEITSKKADLAIGGIIHTMERGLVAKYSSFFHQELWGIICPHPSRLPLWPYILFPFKYESPASIFYILAMLCIIMLFISIISVGQKRATKCHIWRSVYRIFRLGFSFYIKFLSCIYFWNLFFTLMKPNLEASVDSVDNLMISGKEFAIVKGTTVRNVFATSMKPSYRSMASSATYVTTIYDGWRLLQGSGICLVGVPKRFAKASITTTHMTECGEPAIKVGREDLHTVLAGWLTPHGSLLGKNIDRVITRLETFGLLEKWQQDLSIMLSSKSERLPCLFKPISPLTLQDLRLVFMLLLIGYAASIIAYVWELISYHMIYIIYSISECPQKLARKDKLTHTFRQFLKNRHGTTHMEHQETMVIRHQLEDILRDLHFKDPPFPLIRSRSMWDLSTDHLQICQISNYSSPNNFSRNSLSSSYSSLSIDSIDRKTFIIDSERTDSDQRTDNEQDLDDSNKIFKIMVDPIPLDLARASRITPLRQTPCNAEATQSRNESKNMIPETEHLNVPVPNRSIQFH